MKLRAPQTDDAPALGRLFAAAFGHPLDPAVWEWKYRRTPGKARRLVALDESGEALAHAGALGFPARLPGGERVLWQLTDFMGRAAGLRSPLVAAGRALLATIPEEGDAPWIFGFPSPRHFHLGERVFGYRPLRTIVPLAGPLPEAAAPAVALAVSDRCGPEAEAVWEECAVFGVRRSAAFLNWRYCARPDRYYRFYRVAAERPGLAVFGFVGDEALAAELWLPPGSVARAALLAIAADLRSMGMRRWRFWPPAAAGTAAALAELGARPGAEEVFVGCLPAPGEARAPDAAGEVELAMGDHDLV